MAVANGNGLLLSRFVPPATAQPAMTSRLTSLRLLFLTLVIAVLGTGCASLSNLFGEEEVAKNQPVEQIYQEGHDRMRGGAWTNAIERFKRLVAQYPYGPYTEQAMIETAYAQYKSGRHEEAISSIDRFLRTYPTHRRAPYMYYLRGLVNSNRDTVFLQRVWQLDASSRDLAAQHQAYNDFGIVTTRYPNSRYAADALKHMNDLRNIFARHEIETALYYLRRDAWVAATNRASYMIETYPDSAYQNDALAVMASAYTQLGSEQLASDAERVLKLNAPSHAYFSGDWPNYPWAIRKLNPFAGEKSALDND